MWDYDLDGYGEFDDCDDSDPKTYPGAAELESNFDCMTDADDDGYGDKIVLGVSGTDCDDQDASIHPNAPETAGDGIDSNCNGNDDDKLKYVQLWRNHGYDDMQSLWKAL